MKRWNMRLSAIVSLAGLVVCGCDLTSTPDAVITVTPGSAEITGVDTIQIFTAAAADTNRVLALPLEWSASDTSLGLFVEATGLTAVYVSKGGLGNNIITVRDKGDAEGIAVIEHR